MVNNSGGKMVAVEPTLGGQIDLAGNLWMTGYLTIDSASIPNPLSLGYADILISIDEQPTWIPSFLIESLVSFLAETFKEDLVAFVEPRIRPSMPTRERQVSCMVYPGFSVGAMAMNLMATHCH
jgi:hypothetical protein